jgi:protoporphyrinogen oxidase
VGGLGDRWRMARFADWLERKVASGAERMTVTSALTEAGFSHDMIEGFLRPFLRGVFLDPELQVPLKHLSFIWRMFATGSAVLPATGMEEIPRQLVRRLPPDSVRCAAPVDSVETRVVTLASGERLCAETVVIAADATSAARLLHRQPEAVHWHGVTTVSYDAPGSPVDGPWLVLAGDADGPVNNVCAPAQVAPGYAPAGRQLVTASVLGVDARDDEALDAAIREQLGGWWGAQVREWRLLHVGRIHRALPVMTGDGAVSPTAPVELPAGVSLCGDYLESPSINGALLSGRRAAEVLLGESAVAV